MAKEKAKPEPEPITVAEETPPPPRSYRIHILLGLVIVALAQTTFLYFLLPSQAKLKKDLTDIEQKVLFPPDMYVIPAEGAPTADLQKALKVEKPLGEKFKVQSIRQGAEQMTDQLTVTIIVEVLKKDEAAYDKLYAERQYAIRDAVTVVLRNSSLEERNQTSLITIRRSVKKAINDVLGISYVQSVLCIDPIIEII
jgi:flagellar basal body-associated protein FliL